MQQDAARSPNDKAVLISKGGFFYRLETTWTMTYMWITFPPDMLQGALALSDASTRSHTPTPA